MEIDHLFIMSFPPRRRFRRGQEVLQCPDLVSHLSHLEREAASVGRQAEALIVYIHPDTRIDVELAWRTSRDWHEQDFPPGASAGDMFSDDHCAAIGRPQGRRRHKVIR